MKKKAISRISHGELGRLGKNHFASLRNGFLAISRRIGHCATVARAPLSGVLSSAQRVVMDWTMIDSAKAARDFVSPTRRSAPSPT